jgi:hypothetical protein
MAAGREGEKAIVHSSITNGGRVGLWKVGKVCVDSKRPNRQMSMFEFVRFGMNLF